MPFDQAAVVGTQVGASADAVTGVPEIDALVPDDSTAERQVLIRTGALALYRRAGVLVREAEPPAVAPPELRPACSNAVAACVLAIVDEPAARDALPDVVATLEKRGLRLPHAVIATLLDTGAAAVLERLAPAAGRRLQWLADLEPRWVPRRVRTVEVPEDPVALTALYETGSPDQRVAALTALRRHDPGAARALLQAAFPKESAETRARHVACLEEGVASADEAFLESCLNDRSERVRREALRLLRLLPDSALVQRMAERARGCVTWHAPKRGILGGLRQAFMGGTGATLTLPLPSTFEESWRQDGVVEAPPAGVGERTFWMMQAVAATPPATWEKAFDAAPAEIVRAAHRCDHGGAFLLAVMESATTFRSEAWIRAVSEALLQSREEGVRAMLSPLFERALRYLGPADAEALALRILNDGPELVLALTGLRAPWPDAVSEAFLRAVAAQTFPAAGSSPVMRHAALAIHPRCLDRMPARSDIDGLERPQDVQGRSVLVAFYTVIEHRSRFHQEIDRDHPE